jgi:hypothetical protein
VIRDGISDPGTVSGRMAESNTSGDAGVNAFAESVELAQVRHAAALAQALGTRPVPQAFETTERAVPAGNGV